MTKVSFRYINQFTSDIKTDATLGLSEAALKIF